MCGIFAYFGNNKLTTKDILELHACAMKSKHRGPDNTVSRQLDDKTYLVFHRLKINDQSDNGNQPLNHPNDLDLTLICNGEIYNYKDLVKENNFQMNSSSDCEVILHMYKKYGIEKTIKSLDGVFGFVLIDRKLQKTYVARDPFGVRALYIGTSDTDFTNNNSICISSEMKSIVGISSNIKQFPPGNYYELESNTYTEYHQYNYPIHPEQDTNVIMENIRSLLIKATEKRLLSDRPIGCLLSGGLDSSLITALVARYYPKGELKTFSVGLAGSVDLKYAKMVADYLGTDHHEVIVTEEEMLAEIKSDIKQIECYDTTTVRASTPMLLLSKYIRDNTDVCVIFSGEGSDEASGSYMYFHNAPSPADFKVESERLMKDLCYFDVLRCDKSTAGAGLEVRVPFLDRDFLDYYMSIDPKFKMPKSYHIEKFLLREAFKEENILPDEVLWRIKEGMSDGVSSKKRSWYEIIQADVDDKMSDREFSILQNKYSHNVPLIKESMFYREIFEDHYENMGQTTPYYWLPKWSGDVIEPSARVLNCYSQS
jgi:asparagine synthase (glutamine-hydrolysing)